MQRLVRIRAARRQALELHQLHDQVGAALQGRLLEQSLLGADVERRHLGDGVDQHFVVEPSNRLPVDRQAERIAEAPRLALDLGPLDATQRRRLGVVEGGQIDIGLPVQGADIRFGDQPKTVRAHQHDVEAPVVELLDPDQLADAADPIQRGAVTRLVHRLDHGDSAVARHRVLDHRPIALLENVQRQLGAREQDGAGEREQGHARGPRAHHGATPVM